MSDSSDSPEEPFQASPPSVYIEQIPRQRLKTSDPPSSSRSSFQTHPSNQKDYEKFSPRQNHLDEEDENLILTQDMTLKDRQEAINLTHPFGIRLWKPALYKKTRTIEQVSYQDVHEQPSTRSDSNFFLFFGNFIWTVMFGWWLALCYFICSFFILILSGWTTRGLKYYKILSKLGIYIFWPFGHYISRNSYSLDTEPLLPKVNEPNLSSHHMTSFDESGQIPPSSLSPSQYEQVDDPEIERKPNNVFSIISKVFTRCSNFSFSDWIFYTLFFLILGPLHLLVTLFCFLFVVSIPMAKLTSQLIHYVYSCPLEIDVGGTNSVNGEILLCTYKAFGWRYYKYTYDGINIIFINLLSIVLLALADGFLLSKWLNHQGIADPVVVFALCIVSIIPLAYFIGMAVASISSQSSFGLGAVINASFGSIVEIILYCLAMMEGKGLLVEGAIIGSFIGTLLLLPGVSMISGGIGKWKEQRFNVKSTGVSTVLLIMALIGAFTPTIFYSIYGHYELKCGVCEKVPGNVSVSDAINCKSCLYQLPHNPAEDPFYKERVKPLMYMCSAILPFAYLVGLWFTLRTHVKQIYSEKKLDAPIVLEVYPQSSQRPKSDPTHESIKINLPSPITHSQLTSNDLTHAQSSQHDAPEWSKHKSAFVLLVATILFSLVAELLVDSVGEIIANYGVNEKFLGLTLFAIVPSFTEFMNAVAFAMYGNVALSLEIGSAYAVQIALIQIPCLVGFSAFWNMYSGVPDTIEKSFTLIFPQWDCYTVFFSVFLLSYTFVEGKSNYFKGSILALTYIVLLCSFYYAS